MKEKKVVCDIILIFLTFVGSSTFSGNKRIYDTLTQTHEAVIDKKETQIKFRKTGDMLTKPLENDVQDNEHEACRINDEQNHMTLLLTDQEIITNFRYEIILKFVKEYTNKEMFTEEIKEFRKTHIDNFSIAYPNLMSYKNDIFQTKFPEHITKRIKVISDHIKLLGNTPCNEIKRLYFNLINLPFTLEKATLKNIFIGIKISHIIKYSEYYNNKEYFEDVLSKKIRIYINFHITALEARLESINIIISKFLSKPSDYMVLLNKIFFETSSDKDNIIYPCLLGLLVYMPEITFYVEWKSKVALRISNIAVVSNHEDNRKELIKIQRVLERYLKLSQALYAENSKTEKDAAKDALKDAIKDVRLSIDEIIKKSHPEPLEYIFFDLGFYRENNMINNMVQNQIYLFLCFILAFTADLDQDDPCLINHLKESNGLRVINRNILTHFTKNKSRSANVTFAFNMIMNKLKRQSAITYAQNDDQPEAKKDIVTDSRCNPDQTNINIDRESYEYEINTSTCDVTDKITNAKVYDGNNMLGNTSNLDLNNSRDKISDKNQTNITTENPILESSRFVLGNNLEAIHKSSLKYRQNFKASDAESNAIDDIIEFTSHELLLNETKYTDCSGSTKEKTDNSITFTGDDAQRDAIEDIKTFLLDKPSSKNIGKIDTSDNLERLKKIC